VDAVRLLISVRNAIEATRAVAGGADIVDAKEPAGGSLGAVAPPLLAAIRDAVPARLDMSAALGDIATAEEQIRALAAVTVPLSFVKLGFRGVADPRRIAALLSHAVDRAARVPGCPGVIAVAYADHRPAESLAPDAFPDLVADAGAEGLLLDTCFKDGPRLFDLIDAAALTGIGRALAAHELLFALGGSLGTAEIRVAGETGAGIFGVRGAACRGGRTGEIDQDLVVELAQAIRCQGALSSY
jgi:hypothetical protein